ncbi:glycosyltransferase [Nocardia huaxiensis]|uniref:Glycosyltransferase n=1 Tax=Nocardia huaxiensis TaxID=2755382 RepID=A0A7D6VFX3_9NOCA|nr:glycosyltransferase [Nocardia huaxiensis]
MVVPPYFDTPPKAYGGVEAVVADLVDALVDRGHEVTLLGAGENGTRAQRFVPLWDRIQAERLGDPFPEVVHALKVRRALERLAVGDGFDLVHDHTFAGVLNLPAYRDLGLPLVITVHGPVDGDPYIYYSELGDDAHLVAISDRQRRNAPDLNWVGRVHNALRVEDWPFRAEKEDYALFLGRFTECKAPHLALEAAHAADLPLILAGKCAEPPEVKYFDSAVRPLLTERDTMFGMADAAAKRELLSRARCLLFPVRWEEPFGMVMIEAMVCGTPVVALRGGAVGEVIVDGVTGRICDDPAELPAAVKEVQTYDPEAMRAHVIEHFGADTLGRGYEEIYREVARTRKPRRGRVTTIHTWTSSTHQSVPSAAKAAGTGPGRASAPIPTTRATAAPGRASGTAGRGSGGPAARGNAAGRAPKARATGPDTSRVPAPALPPVDPIPDPVLLTGEGIVAGSMLSAGGVNPGATAGGSPVPGVGSAEGSEADFGRLPLPGSALEARLSGCAGTASHATGSAPVPEPGVVPETGASEEGFE